METPGTVAAVTLDHLYYEPGVYAVQVIVLSQPTCDSIGEGQESRINTTKIEVVYGSDGPPPGY